MKWAYVMQASEQGLNALLTFVFAAVLGPKDFGTVAMGMAYILFVRMFLEQGLVPALVQRKDLRPEHLDSVFWLNLVASLVLVFLSILLSSWWASVNHLPQLGPIISVLSLTIPLEALTIVQRALLQRNSDFRGLSIRSVASVIAGGTVGLTMALMGYGVWSLVAKQLSTDIIGTVALWSVGNWRPKFFFSARSVTQLLGFSAGAFAGNLGLFINSQSDALLIGLFFGPVSVGLYRLAARITAMVVSLATSSLQAASFPEFCKLQDNPDALRKSLLSCCRLAAIVTVPALGGVFAISSPLMLAIGPKWADAAGALKILCIVAIAQPVLYFVGPLLQALSKPHVLAVIEWIHAAIGAGSLAVAGELLKDKSSLLQVNGIAVTRFATTVLLLTPAIVWAFRHFAGVRFGSLARTIAPSFLTGGVTGLVVLVTSSVLFHPMKPWPALVSEIVLGVFISSGMLLLLERGLRRTASQLLIRAFGQHVPA